MPPSPLALAVALQMLLNVASAATPATRAASGAASAPLPPVNLQVEVRMVDAAAVEGEDDSAAENLRRRKQGYTASTQPSGAHAPWTQQAQVRNGQWASLQMMQSQPFQWVRAAGRPSGSGAAAAGAGGGGVFNEVSWLPSGTAWSVRPEWPGGQAAARVDFEVRAASLQPGAGNAPVPGVNASQYRSTVMAPLEAWVTVARLGSPPTRSSGQTWSTDQAGARTARVLQVRVSQP